jgi:serine/threonine protein kinase/tetratricopeptide (TPR) repeat protein
MTFSEWQRIEELFQAALQLQALERSVYLTNQCRENEELRREVESLLEASESDVTFIEQPAVSLGLKVLSSQSRQLIAGQSIGHYRIVRPLGSGGMGEVYLAEDCTLERQVALKFLAGGLGNDQWAKEQLMKEARAVARLENSNICGVHGLEEIGQDTFIVMPYVEGETLASLLRRETPSLDRALDFAEQTVGALAAAHLHGVIHRDIKPQNIVVTPEGRIKVLDFGLAKLVQQNRGVSKDGAGIDQTSQVGGVMGTIAYMSPEQIRGEELDGRSDIFSLGIVLYEMLGGCNPFVRDTNEEILLAIKEKEPSSLRAVPENLVSIVRRCLAKNRTERFETTEDLLSAIQAIRAERGRPAVVGYFDAMRRHRHFRKYAAAALALFVSVLGASSFIYSRVSAVHTLAIVPITNLSADSSLDYLSTGLTRTLYEKFSYLPRLTVRLPTEVPSTQTDEIVRAGRQLRVESVMSGEILKQGESLMLRVRVFDTADGTLRMEHTSSIDTTNLFALQDDITRRVTSALGLWLIGNEKKLLTKQQTDSEEALRSYMKGRVDQGLRRNRDNIKAAINNFQHAVDLDPAFARAYTGLADCYVIMQTVTYGEMTSREAINKARWNALKALEIDYSLPEAQTSMGVIRLRHDWEWRQAEQDFKRAIDLKPSYAPAHYWYSNLLAVMHRFDEAISESERARELDPYSPLSAMNYGRALYYARRFEAANEYFGTLLKEKPDYAQFLNLRGLVQLQLQDVPAAIITLEKLRSLDYLMAAAPLGYAYGKAGQREKAEEILRKLDDLSRDRHIPVQEKAIIHMGMGDFDEAFSLLEESFGERFAALAYLNTDPLYDDLRGDPRFEALARRIGVFR